MLNESKIKVMTKMAAYEKNGGKKDIAICRYFKGDYIGLGLLKTGISVTIAYLMCVLVYVVCNLDEYLQNLTKLDYYDIIGTIGKYYILVLMIFIIIGYGVYSYRYDKAQKNIVSYSKRLKKLEKFYRKER